MTRDQDVNGFNKTGLINTTGMLSAAKEFIEEKINPNAKVVMYGQEVNDKTWAVAQADLLLKGETA